MKNFVVCMAFAVVGLLAADAFAQNCCGDSCGVAGKVVSKVRTTAGRVVCGAACATKGVVHKAKAVVNAGCNTGCATSACATSACATSTCATTTTVTTVTTTSAAVVAADCGCGDCCCKEGVVSKAAKRVRGTFACAKERRCARKAARNTCCAAATVTTVSCDSCAVSAAPTVEPTAALPPAPNAAEATLLSPNN